MNLINKIKNYLKASYPALYVLTHEETRFIQELLTISSDDSNISVHAWDLQQGLVCLTDETLQHPEDSSNSTELLEYLQKYKKFGSIFVLRDFHLHFDKAINVRLLRNAWNKLKALGSMIIFVGHKYNLPGELQKEVQLLDYELPGVEAIRERLQYIVASANAGMNAQEMQISVSPEVTENSVEAARGMTNVEVENAFALAYITAKKFNQNFTSVVFEEKIAQLKKNGLLTYLKPELGFESVGGLQGLKTWLTARKKAYTEDAKSYNLPLPKGILLASVPGSGKSLICKAIAKEFDCPLFALDIGNIFGSLVGDSEKNMRELIKTIESIGKCIILIDEIEKSFNSNAVSGSGDSGVSSRIFGTFLTWLNDRTNPAFIVATSNNHTILPPALIRKGRFDQLFWLDLPLHEERKEIFEVVIRKYKREVENFNIKALVKGSEGFTGAEIEEVFKDALFKAFDAGEEVNDKHLAEVLSEFIPFSVSHEEDLKQMRKQAQGKLVMVSSKGDPVADVQKNMRKLSIAISND